MTNQAIAAAALLAAGLAGGLARGEEPPARPHIIFVLADDMGRGDLGCYGGAIAPTPNLDQLAADGLRFTQYYAASPICSPSRCGLITGQFPARWRINSFLQTKAGNRGCEQADYLDPQAPSLPRALEQAGYKTAHFGKWHLGGGRDVDDAPAFAQYGYDEAAGTWESPEPHPDITAKDWIWSDQDKVKRWDRTAFFIDRTLDFLARHQDSPCFVNVWLDDPHTPWVPDAAADPKKESRPQLRRVIIENDRQIGRLREGLRQLKIDQSTLLVFTCDNGPLPTFNAKRTIGLRGSKLSLYEGGVREPFIACWPARIPAGKVDEQTVLAAVDLFPTFCRLAGAEPAASAHADGEDQSAALSGTPRGDRSRPLFWEYGRNDESFSYPRRAGDRSPTLAVRDGNWKLLVNPDGSGGELYDLARDSAETVNLAADHPDVVARLSAAVLQWKGSLPR